MMTVHQRSSYRSRISSKRGPKRHSPYNRYRYSSSLSSRRYSTPMYKRATASSHRHVRKYSSQPKRRYRKRETRSYALSKLGRRAKRTTTTKRRRRRRRSGDSDSVDGERREGSNEQLNADSKVGANSPYGNEQGQTEEEMSQNIQSSLDKINAENLEDMEKDSAELEGEGNPEPENVERGNEVSPPIEA